MKTRTLSKRQGFLLQKFRNVIIESAAKYGACYRKKTNTEQDIVRRFSTYAHIYMNARERAHAYARARERYRHTHIIWFPVRL